MALPSGALTKVGKGRCWLVSVVLGHSRGLCERLIHAVEGDDILIAEEAVFSLFFW